MILLPSRIREIFRRLPPLAMAAIAAVLVGLPSPAGATFLRPPGIPSSDLTAGGSLGSHPDSLSLEDLHADFIEHALNDFDVDFEFHRLLPSADAFERHRLRRRHGDDTPFDGPGRHWWIEEAPGGRHDFFFASPRPRPSCKPPEPPVVPEPGTVVLFGSGLIGLAFAGRKRRL